MRKWLASVLLVCLATGSFFSEATVSPVLGATKAVNSDRSATKSIQMPVHEQIVFNDYQVVGLSTKGWNWVRNDEFILPPQTPLEIDLVQTTYGSGKTENKTEVFLDGVALPEFSSETAEDVSTLRWEVPRFTIPYEKLPAGNHTLTFIVSDALGEMSTVHVRFRVEALHYPLIYQGSNSIGPTIPSGSIEAIYGNYGAKVYNSNEPGSWKLTNTKNGSIIKAETGNVFSTGVLIAGDYELSFTPDDLNQTPWQVELRVGPPVLYLGTDENGQQLSNNQKITAEKAPDTLQLFSPAPGRWWVDGTGQTLVSAQHFEVMIPEKLEGMTMSVNFEPDQSLGTERSSNSMISVQIQIPGAPAGCDASSARASLDVMVQNNEGSSLLAERENLYPSDITVKVYQNPIHKIWVTTAADHLKHGDGASEEGPGVWAVDNVVVDSAYLNWDHTALELSHFKEGRHKINYYSKANPEVTWCGYIQIIEDSPPTPSTPTCDIGEKGTVPPSTKMKLKAESGKEFVDGDKITVESSEDLEALQLLAVHVENKGMKRVKREKNKNDRRFLYVSDLQWEYGVIPFGANYEYGDGLISSNNKVVIKYDGEIIKTIKPKSSEDNEPGGREILDLPSIIARDGRSGEYKVEVYNTMTYRTCDIVSRYKSYKKYLEDVDQEQKLVLTVEVK